MNAILYVCHGSRSQAAREQAATFIQKCLEKSPAPIREYGFLEYAKPTIEESFRSCVRKGATMIAVVPVLLLTAAHAKTDIPNELTRIMEHFPKVTVSYGRPIGVNTKMIVPITERIRETGIEITENSLVLLVGRGSSDPDVKRDLNKLADILIEQTSLGNVKTCFLTAAEPSLKDALNAAAEERYDKVFVVPYLFFTGILMKRIRRIIEMTANCEKFVLCQCLGYHPEIEKILLESANHLLSEGNIC